MSLEILIVPAIDEMSCTGGHVPDSWEQTLTGLSSQGSSAQSESGGKSDGAVTSIKSPGKIVDILGGWKHCCQTEGHRV